MPAQEGLQQQQEMDVNKEKLIYSPPALLIIGTMKDVAHKSIGVSEQICGCGAFS